MKLLQAIDHFVNHDRLERTNDTVHGRKMDLRHLCVYLRNPELEEINDYHVCQYLQDLVDYGWTLNGVYKKAITFRVFWKYWNKKKHPVFDHELIPIIKVPARIPNIASPEAYRKLMEAIPDRGYKHIRNKAIISLLWHTGARCGEICSLDLKNIDLKNCKALIKTEKSRGQRPFREIFWTDPTNETKKYLKSWLKERTRLEEMFEFNDPDALFISRPRSIQWRRITNHSVNIFMRKYSKKAKIATMNPHSFRHHFAHDIVHKGGSNADVMNFLGHARLESSRIYTQMHGKELEERYKYFKEVAKSSS